MVLGLRRRGCLQGQRCGGHFRGVHSARGLRAIAALPRACILIAACRGAVSAREGKEPRTTPGGAGDGAGDGGQARISRALPVEAIGDDGDGVALALIIANEHRAGLEAAPWRATVPRQPVQEPQAFPIEPAKGPLLQAISDHSPQEVLAQICWRGSSEDHAPVAPKRVKRKRAQMSNLGLDRGRVCRVPPQGYALGTLVASPEALPATIRYRRSPSVFSDSSLSPSLLRTTAARKARTVCGCQPVERVTVAMVAPLGPHSSASTRACFEFARRGLTANGRLRTDLGGRPRLDGARRFALGHAKTPLNSVGATARRRIGATARRHHPNPAEAHRRWRGERSKPVRLGVRDHHTRSLCAESPAQTAQWCCWLCRRRIIF